MQRDNAGTPESAAPARLSVAKNWTRTAEQIIVVGLLRPPRAARLTEGSGRQPRALTFARRHQASVQVSSRSTFRPKRTRLRSLRSLRRGSLDLGGQTATDLSRRSHKPGLR